MLGVMLALNPLTASNAQSSYLSSRSDAFFPPSLLPSFSFLSLLCFLFFLGAGLKLLHVTGPLLYDLLLTSITALTVFGLYLPLTLRPEVPVCPSFLH